MRAVLPVLFVATSCCAAAADPGDSIRAILEATPEAKQCFWGIRVLDADTGEVIFAHNDDKFFVPASNTKLFTSSLALHRFGPDYQLPPTRVVADAKPDADGTIKELRLIGGGDPNLSARTLPYNVKQEFGPDPLAGLRDLAEKVAAAGVRRVDGDIVGDDTAWLWEPYPPGWALDDPTWEYGAPVSALTFNDNAVGITVFPGAEPGTPASVAISPAIEYLTVQNRTRTVGPGGIQQITIKRLPGSREVIVSGTMIAGSKAYESSIAVEDPALFAAYAFRSLLESEGILVSGATKSLHRIEGQPQPEVSGVQLASLPTAPLSRILQVSNKVSQNLHTEMMLREIARAKAGVGSRREGLREISGWLGECGAEADQAHFEDASGLSRLTLVTPGTISKVLLAMYRSPERGVWISTLPTGGVDGTLERRFEGKPEAARIHAKTGTISHVSALSGYAETASGHTRIFSILVNNFNSLPKPVRAAMDRIALALVAD